MGEGPGMETTMQTHRCSPFSPSPREEDLPLCLLDLPFSSCSRFLLAILSPTTSLALSPNSPHWVPNLLSEPPLCLLHPIPPSLKTCIYLSPVSFYDTSSVPSLCCIIGIFYRFFRQGSGWDFLIHYFSSFFLKLLYLFIFRERGMKGEKRHYIRETLISSPMPLTGDLDCNPGMCPDWESNWQPFSSQAATQPAKPHWPGPCFS